MVSVLPDGLAMESVAHLCEEGRLDEASLLLLSVVRRSVSMSDDDSQEAYILIRRCVGRLDWSRPDGMLRYCSRMCKFVRVRRLSRSGRERQVLQEWGEANRQRIERTAEIVTDDKNMLTVFEVACSMRYGRGCITEAARRLGVSRKTLWKRIRMLDPEGILRVTETVLR